MLAGQHEMLMDHPQAGGNGLRRRPPFARRSINQDLAGVGTMQPINDIHRRGFAGAVFADNGMDAALSDPQRYAVIRQHRSKSLADVPQLNCCSHRLRGAHRIL